MSKQRTKLPRDLDDLRKEYAIAREIGRGGTGVVYLATDRELGREVAIKLVQSPLRSDEETIQRFVREARTAALLHHPNIVGVHAVKRLRNGAFAMVMQYVPGGTLKELIRAQAPLPFHTVERVLRDVAAALVYAHDRGIVHRDVKPENIFIDTATDRALLADFGIARTNDGAVDSTHTGIAVGTPSYMAPEQIDNAAVDGRADLYSLGMVAWEMLTGEVPWEGETLYGVILRQKTERLPSVRHFRPDVPVHLWDALERLQAKDRAERYPNARALLEALEGARRASIWERWRTEWRLRSAMAPAPPAAPSDPAVVLDLPDEPELAVVDEAQQTIRFQRDAVTPLPPAAQPEPARAADAEISVGPVTQEPAPSLPERAAPRWTRPVGLRRAAAAGGLLLLTTAGATLYAFTRDGEPAGTAGGAGAAVVLPTAIVDATAAPLPAFAAWDSVAAGGEELPPEDEVGVAEAADPAGAAAPSDEPAEPAPPPAAAAAPATPAEEPAPPAPARTVGIAVGGMHSCALSSSGEVLCWGANASGQVGNGATGRASRPVAVAARAQFRDLDAGVSHTCGTTTGGEVFCWGANQHGQLGDGTVAARTAPIRVSGNRRFTAVRAGRSHSCGVTRGGEVFCWGANDDGQLGDGSGRSRSTPARVPGSGFGSVAVGWSHSCALDRNGQAHCWGSNSDGQLGAQGGNASPAPAAVPARVRFRQIVAGSAHSCGLSSSGEVLCWGRNSHGQLGDGTTVGRSEPAVVSAEGAFASITAGTLHTCGLTAGGEAFCWGQNNFGQLGDGTTTDRATPRRVVGGTRFASIHANGAHTCGVTRGGEQFCWGYNIEGQLGDGTRSHRSVPVRVATSES